MGNRCHGHAHRAVIATDERGPFALPPAPTRSHPGSVDRALFRGRGSPRAARPPTSRRSDSPTDARSVGSCCARGEVDRRLDASTSQLTLSRSPTRGGAAPSWDKFENLSGAGCAVLDSSTWKSTARWRAALPQRGYLTQPGVATFCGYPGLVGPCCASILNGLVKDVPGESCEERHATLLQ